MVRFLGVGVALSLLPYVPSLVAPVPTSPLFPLQPEVLVLLTLVVGTASTRWARLGRRVAVTGLFALVLYQTYDAIVYAAFRRSGLFYEDLRFVVDLAYLAADNVSWATAGTTALGVAGAAAAAWGIPQGVRIVARAGRHPVCQRCLWGVHAVAWPLVLIVAPMQDWGEVNLTYQDTSEQIRVRTVTAKMVENAQASLRMHRLLDDLGRAPVDSAYFAYDDLDAPRRPHVYLYMIESYGEVLNRHPQLREPYRRMMGEMQETLAADGWSTATAWSDVAVRGGRSWLAIASVLLGTRVEHQVLYERFLSGAADPRHMVDVFRDRGYRTFTLQPYMVERPGLPIANPYGFDVELYRDDLDYTGPTYGWGVVPMPDQVSLGVAHERMFGTEDDVAHTVRAGAAFPVFFFFETVYSHALWNYGLPPVVDDWRAFERVSGSDTERREALESRALPSTLLPDSLTTPRIFDQPTPLRFLRHVAYEMEVLRQYLQTQVPPNSLILVLGDHQPPLLPVETFGVPVHVMSRDASLVTPFRVQGFTDGWAPQDATPRITHESLFSRLIRALSDTSTSDISTSDTTAARRPDVLPQGISPSILAQ